MRRVLLLTLALSACGSRSGPATPDPAPAPAPAPPAEVAAAPAPEAPRPAAAVEPGEPLGAFQGVIAHTGQARTIEDLRGHPTVVWFFPFAGTPG